MLCIFFFVLIQANCIFILLYSIYLKKKKKRITNTRLGAFSKRTYNLFNFMSEKNTNNQPANLLNFFYFLFCEFYSLQVENK
jgi:hypothetical protein